MRVQDYIAIGYVENASPRVLFGIRMLREALERIGHIVHEQPGGWAWNRYRESGGRKIYVGSRGASEFITSLEEREVLLYHTAPPEEEGFYLSALPGRLLVVSGDSDSGVLYGCQELARIIREEGGLPRDLAVGDAPVFKLRGYAVGLQKTTVEPGRLPFEYPITPDRFPWFYDRAQWTDYLDMLLEHRGNAVFVWNGHPFSSLIPLPEYPEALEVTEDQAQANRETLRWLVEEADRRGIRVVLAFYNIHIPPAFADKHGLSRKQTCPHPVTSDYYRRSLAAFVRAFPTVGLMICLGEQLKGQIYGAEWLCGTILPGVLEGLKGRTAGETPPIIVRSHTIQAEQVMEAASPLYPNLHSEMKYNGESLTTWTPRGKAQALHRKLGSRGGLHVANVHMLSNLEPFRWGAPSFIQKCVQAAKYRLCANALHLYPLSYWTWPYSPDVADIPLRQTERDWIWFEAWLRYAWNPDRDARGERSYWISRLEERYGTREAAVCALEAYEASGACAPMLLRRFGITQGNRQTMSLGMTMSQLTNPDRHVPWPELWESHAPQGERPEEYVLKELAGIPHVGETPVDVIEETERLAEEAERAVRRGAAFVSRNKTDYDRLAADVEAIRAMTCAYTSKVRAALLVLTVKHTAAGRYADRIDLLEEAGQWLERSLGHYRRLAAIAGERYQFANGMQTRQRKVPFRDGASHSHWRDCLPPFEAELASFRYHVRELKAGNEPILPAEYAVAPARYEPVDFELLSDDAQTYRIEKGARVFTDGDVPIISCAEELYGLTGVRFNQVRAVGEAIPIELVLKAPAKLLIGYFNSTDGQWLQPPAHDPATCRSCGCLPVIGRGVRLFGYPSAHVHAFRYEAGRHTLRFGPGAYLILGAVRADQPMPPRDFEPHDGGLAMLDWLYEHVKEAAAR